MRIVVADYSGHPFQVQLSRQLARRGHSVLHLYFSEFQTPKGRLSKSADDPQTLDIEPVCLGVPFVKQNFFKRRFQEVVVGKRFAHRISAFDPSVVIASNLPLDALRIVSKRAKAERRDFIFWQQDIYSVAIDRILRQRFGLIGAVIGRLYKAIERNVLRHSQAVVAISEDFIPYLRSEFGLAAKTIHVIENWAPLDEITPQHKDNTWAVANGLAEKKVVLYSGTLGLKHDPKQILALARALAPRSDAEIVVISEGPAAEWLAKKADELRLTSLRVMKFQPFDIYPNVLGSANVLLCILETDAGIFSVPSKVLSYLCAARPIVLSAPHENLACRTVTSAEAGKVVSPSNTDELIAAVTSFLDDEMQCEMAGERGRNYANKAFDIDTICDRFELILLTSCVFSRTMVDVRLDSALNHVVSSISAQTDSANPLKS